MKNTSHRIQYLLLMAMFGCLGPVVRAIGLPSVVTACLRAWISTLVLVPFMMITGRKLRKESFKKTIFPMIVCGVLLFGDWFGLFMAYNYTTIATATICYYIVPILVLLGSALFLREKMTTTHIVCAVVAFIGMFLASGGSISSFSGIDLRGPLFSLIGAVSYAGIVIINKRFPEGDPVVRTTIQLAVAAVFTSPYVFATTDFAVLEINGKTVAYLLLLGVVMTAAAYIAYFSLILKIPSRSVAIFAYADPIVAVLISVLIMREPLAWQGYLGAVMIIGAAIVSEK